MMMITTWYDLHKLCCAVCTYGHCSTRGTAADLYAVVADDDDSDDDTICRWDDVM